MSLSFYHSSGHFTKRFSACPLNFVFISTIAFLIFMQEVVYALSLLMANCAWLTSSFLYENIGCSALHNRLVFPPLDIIPSASTFLLSCSPSLPFIPHTTRPAAACSQRSWDAAQAGHWENPLQSPWAEDTPWHTLPTCLQRGVPVYCRGYKSFWSTASQHSDRGRTQMVEVCLFFPTYPFSSCAYVLWLRVEISRILQRRGGGDAQE